MEHTEDHVLDADIFINYHTKEIKFEKQVKRSNPVVGALKLMILFFIVFGGMTLYNAYTTKFPKIIYDIYTGEPTVYQTAWDYYLPEFKPIITIVIAFPILLEFLEVWWSSEVPWLRDRMLDNKRRRKIASVDIPNPSGTIIYRFSGNSEPLLDIEYNDDIANALVESSLVREKEQKKFLKHLKYNRSYMCLKIVLSRQANGILKIIEY